MDGLYYAMVEMALSGMTIMEIATLNVVAQTNGNPRGRLFNYEQVAHLFTEDGGTRMHDEIKAALAAYVKAHIHGA